MTERFLFVQHSRFEGVSCDFCIPNVVGFSTRRRPCNFRRCQGQLVPLLKLWRSRESGWRDMMPVKYRFRRGGFR